MSNYLHNNNTPIFNNLMLGTSLSMSPEVENVVETKKMRKEIEVLTKQQPQNLATVQQGIERTMKGVGEVLHRGMGTVNQSVQTGFRQVDSTMREGFRGVERGMENMTGAMQSGFEGVSRGMQDVSNTMAEGFGGVQRDMESMAGAVQNGFEGMQGNLQQMNRSMDAGFDHMQRGMAQMGGVLAEGLQQVDADLQVGFYTVNQNLALGFEGVATAVYASNAHLGEQMMQGFESLASGQQQLANATSAGFGQLAGITDAGFQRMAQHIAAGFEAQLLQTLQEGQQNRAAIDELMQTISEEHAALRQALQAQHEELSQVLLQGFNLSLSAMAREGILQRHSLQRLHQDLRGMSGQLAQIDETLKHLKRHHANDHFLPGMRYLAGLKLDKAKTYFNKALDEFGGHFQSLLMLGYVAVLEGEIATAQEYFEEARLQAGHEGQQQQEQAIADLYLARLAFAQALYEPAYELYSQALKAYPALFSALVESITAYVLSQPHDPTIEAKIKRMFHGKYGRNEYVCWYALALELSPHHGDWTLKALRNGLALHSAGQLKRADLVWAALYRLNRRYLRELAALIATVQDLAWLHLS